MTKDILIDEFASFISLGNNMSYNDKEFIKDVIRNKAELIHYEKDSIVYEANFNANHLFFINLGSVKICDYHTDYTEKIVRINYAPNLVGCESILLDSKHELTAITLEDMDILSIERDFMDDMMKNKNAIYGIMKILLRKNRKIEKEKHCITTLSARERFIYFIDTSKQVEEYIDDKTLKRIDINMKNYEIASMLNMKPEVLSRIIKDLRNENILFKINNKYYINQKENV